jgi:hypothetical protein
MICGEEMRLVDAVPDDTALVPGFEHHTLVCPSCHDEERRLVFVHHPAPLSPGSSTEPAGPDVQNSTLQSTDQPAATDDGDAAQAADSMLPAEVTTAEHSGRNSSLPKPESWMSQHSRAANSRMWGRTAELHRARWQALCGRLGLRGASDKADEGE